ncbi:hypothetical protein LZ554_006677 [Drepanopeziza brunnea f. sp. 'monogermtubi']|nr:hypothetical protein LZ554_006677 [Drepanopeziza brunnea f. sp. 'monogermtubi']
MAHTNTNTNPQIHTPQLETIWARLSSSSSSSSAAARHPCASRAEFDIVCAAFLQAESGFGGGTQAVRRYRAEWNVWAYYFGEQEPFPGIDPAQQQQQQEQEKEQEHHDDPLGRYSYSSNSQSQQPYSSSQSQDRRYSHEYRHEHREEYEDGEYQDDEAQARSYSRDDNGTYRSSEGRDRSDGRQDDHKQQHTSEARRDDARDDANDKDQNTTAASSSRDRTAIIHAGGENQRNSDAARGRSDIRDSNNNGGYQKEGYLARIIRQRAERRNRKFIARQPPLGERRRNGEGDGNRNRDERSLSPRMDDDRARYAREDRRQDKRDDQRTKADAHTVDGATAVREKEDRGGPGSTLGQRGAAGDDLVNAARKLQIDFPSRAAAERNARNRAGLKKREAMEERARTRLRGQDLEEQRHVGRPYQGGGRWADRGRDDGDRRRYVEKGAEGLERVVGRWLVADRYRPGDAEAAARDEEGRARGGGGGSVWGGVDVGAGSRGVDRRLSSGRGGRHWGMDMSEGEWFGGGEIEDLYHNRGRDGGGGGGGGPRRRR